MNSEPESTKGQCAVPGCARPAETRGVCNAHYFHRHDKGDIGDLVRKSMRPSNRGRKAQARATPPVQQGRQAKAPGPGAGDEAAVAAIRAVLRLLDVRSVDLPVEGGHAFIAAGGTALLRADGTLVPGRLNVGQ